MKLARPVSITEAARNFSDFVNRVAYRGERFFLVRGKRQVAELRPVRPSVTRGEWAAILRNCPSLGKKEASAYIEDLDQGEGPPHKAGPKKK
ncbi:MAG: hypothetical protein AAFY98_04840 [Verrucomicrobiota bacterium]